jgi:hypothetical protein
MMMRVRQIAISVNDALRATNQFSALRTKTRRVFHWMRCTGDSRAKSLRANDFERCDRKEI